MAHKVVRTRSNQRLVYLNGNRTAPIAPEKLACPYGQQEKGGFDQESDQSKRGCVRKKARAKAGDRKEEQKLRRSDQSGMNAAAKGAILASWCPLRLWRRLPNRARTGPIARSISGFQVEIRHVRGSARNHARSGSIYLHRGGGEPKALRRRPRQRSMIRAFGGANFASLAEWPCRCLRHRWECGSRMNDAS